MCPKWIHTQTMIVMSGKWSRKTATKQKFENTSKKKTTNFGDLTRIRNSIVCGPFDAHASCAATAKPA